MLPTHRPWASGHQAFYIPPHDGGVAEGWIGESIPKQHQSTSKWVLVHLEPKFVQPNAYVHMVYNGQKLPSRTVYSTPCVSEVVVTVDRDTQSWPKGKVLGSIIFPYQADDVNLVIEGRQGVWLVNGHTETPLYPMGGAVGKGIHLQMASFFPQMMSPGNFSISSRVKEASTWGRKTDDVPLIAHIKQGGIVIQHQNKVWTSTDIEELQYPSYRLCLKSTA